MWQKAQASLRLRLVGSDVCDAGDGLDLVEEEPGPMIELPRISIVERVLIHRFGHASSDGDVLRSLHIKRDPLDFGQVRSQPRDYLIHAAALILGLERNVNAAVIDRGVAAAGTDRRPDRGDRRIFHEGVEQSLLALRHSLEGDVLRGLRQADDQSGVLLGKETLGNQHVEIAGQRDCADHGHERDEAVPQHDLEARLIEVEQAIEAAFEKPVEPSVLLALRLEQARAHHRRQRQRDYQRENECHADGDGKFTEQQSDIATHQEQRNEHGDQRQGDRHNGEADLACSL
jgi:hypothetical protein